MIVIDKEERRRQIAGTRNAAFIMLAVCAAAIGIGGEMLMLVGLAVNAVVWFIYVLYLSADLHESRPVDYVHLVDEERKRRD